MFLLHQSALYNNIVFLAPEGLEPPNVMMKTLCLNPLTIEPLSSRIPISIVHCIDIYGYILEVQCKYRTCFSWLQNSYITFMLTRRIKGLLF